MPRTAENAKSLAADLAARLERLVAAARQEGREEALAEVRSLVGGGGALPAPKRGPGRPRKTDAPAKPAAKARKSGAKRKNPWAEMTPAARLARVNAIRVGRGLAPKDKL